VKHTPFSIFFTAALLFTIPCSSQDIDQLINAAEVERIERVLSADDMQGRRTFTPGIDKAADFIADEFKKAGLQPAEGSTFFQSFMMVRTRFIGATAKVNGREMESKRVVAITSQRILEVTSNSGYSKVIVRATDTLQVQLRRLQAEKKNFVVVVDTVHAAVFNRIREQRRQQFSSENNIVLLLTNELVETYSVAYEQETTEMPLKNVAGMLPGRSRKQEYVIFSGHYDHLGIGRPNKDNDSIYNGANDDAAGTTAVIMLARYFARQKNNERTLIFVAFTAEEIGGFGAQYFSRRFDPAQVMAMFNIEMIGTESKWGPDAAYITGYEKSSMGRLLQSNLEGSKFQFYPDPYTTQNLFYRSDNATLARLGVPAHTISTSRMEADTKAVIKEKDAYYHTADDEIETLDMKNMAEIIKAIALSSRGIVSGKETPSRVDPVQLR
jgi:hypothetical protein